MTSDLNIVTCSTVAAGALQRGGIDADPKIVYTPDGLVVSKAARVSDLRPNCVLVLSCGESFDGASVPERAKRMHASAQVAAQRLGPLVRAPPTKLLDEAPPPVAEMMPEPAWRFSPSGKWGAGGLEQRHHYRA